MVVVAVTQDDGIESGKTKAQRVRIATQHFALAGVEQNPPVVGLDQYREVVLSEQLWRGDVVVRQDGDLQTLDHRDTPTPLGSKWPCLMQPDDSSGF